MCGPNLGSTIPFRKVFISCTTHDLGRYRQNAAEVIKELNEEFQGKFQLVVVTMDNHVPSGDQKSAVEASMDMVRGAHWFVLIVAWYYGLVPPDRKQSVTEREYWCARDRCRSRFVFIAGEDTDDGLHRYARKEKKREPDLHEWRDNSPDSRVQAFKDVLRGHGEFQLFTDIEHFRRLLRDALKRKIDEELTQIGLGEVARDRELLLLILSQRMRIECCINEMEVLARFKRVHDHLHKIRQKGICRWRNELLGLWRQGPIDRDSENTFLDILLDIRQERLLALVERDGLSRIERDSQSPDRPFTDGLQKVLNFDLPDRQSIVSMDRKGFERKVDLFARLVQRVFSAAAFAMERQLDVLRKGYTELLKELSDARADQSLSSSQDEVLNDRLQAIEKAYNGLSEVLRCHSRWQQFHDDLERLDLETEDGRFMELELDWDSYRDSIRELLKAAEAEHMYSGYRFTQKAGRLRSFFSEEWDGAKKRKERSDNYDAMRQAFDCLFFEVDTQTLTYVNHCDERVKCYKDLLQDLEMRFRADRHHL